MPLIDSTYFDGPLIIAGLSGDDISDAVDAAIALYEPEYLRRVFGPSLYDAFVAGTTDLDDLDERWDWVVNGHTFTYNNLTYYWPGLVKASAPLQSPIANYVYYKYRQDNATLMQSTGGEAQAAFENAQSVSAARKMIKAWNQMVDWNRTFWIMVDSLRDGSNDPIYPEWERYGTTDDRWEMFQLINMFGI